MRAVRIVATSHTGCVRERNEDALTIGGWVAAQGTVPAVTTVADAEPTVVAVADGMGGHPAGDQASKIAVEALARRAPDMTAAAEVTAALMDTQRALRDYSASRPETTGMGTTVAGLAVTARSVIVFNVGDSPVYEVVDGYLAELSTDDRTPRMPGQPADVPIRTLTQSLGSGTTLGGIAPHVHERDRSPGALYLVCSDGLTDALGTAEISRLIAGDGIAGCEKLLAAALDAGAADNVSLVLVET